jgi:hypothetical protein
MPTFIHYEWLIQSALFAPQPPSLFSAANS